MLWSYKFQDHSAVVLVVLWSCYTGIFKTRGLVISGYGLKWPDPRSRLPSDRYQMIAMCEVK